MIGAYRPSIMNSFFFTFNNSGKNNKITTKNGRWCDVKALLHVKQYFFLPNLCKKNVYLYEIREFLKSRMK